MCGRYLFKSEVVQQLLPMEYQPLPGVLEIVKQGEVFPTTLGLVITNTKTIPMRFGVDQPNHQGIYINARSEQVQQRQTFKQGFMLQPCVVVTNGFYEWDDKVKYLVATKDPIIYLGAFYLTYQDKLGKAQQGFVILTTQASDSMASIHDRMPVIINQQEIGQWLDYEGRVKLMQRIGSEVFYEPVIGTYHQPALFD